MSAQEADRDGGKEAPARPVPRTRRGRLTRSTLLAAAREVFERDGFLDAKISEISATAGVATGSFYTYFADKDEVFAALLEETQEEMLHPGVHHAHPNDEDPVAMIEESNRAYLEAYRANAKLMRVFEQVATIDERFKELRRRRALAFAERNARSIRRLQKAGKADPEIDAFTASLALSSMVSRMAYFAFAIGLEEAQPDFDELVRTVSRLWANALRISEAPAGPRPVE
jgi:AcrR family transcriptional regulator